MVRVFAGGQSNYQPLAEAGEALRPTLVTLYVQFQDLAGVNNNPVNPTVQIFTADDANQPVEAIGILANANGSYNPTPVAGQPGRYSFAFLTTGMAYGIYRVTWSGTFTDTTPTDHTVEISGTIEIGAISRTQDYINRIKQALRDDFPAEYEISEPVPQWQPTQLFTYLREGSGRFNAIGPRRTTYDAETFPFEIDNLLVTLAECFALWGRARLEKANEMDYSDGHTLRIARADFYKQLADTLYKDVEDVVQQWKKMTPPTPIGLKSQQVPFRIFRMVGMLPNSQSFFSS